MPCDQPGHGIRVTAVVLMSTARAVFLQHASLLLGVAPDELLLVDEDGSPHGPKQFVMWNPPLTWEAQQVGCICVAANPRPVL